VTPGKAHDAPAFPALLAALPEGGIAFGVADRAYGSGAIRWALFE
jgi:hypothetical protein